ncbi:17978_t:CDS:1, partial [Gigaspora margarita]
VDTKAAVNLANVKGSLLKLKLRYLAYNNIIDLEPETWLKNTAVLTFSK